MSSVYRKKNVLSLDENSTIYYTEVLLLIDLIKKLFIGFFKN